MDIDLSLQEDPQLSTVSLFRNHATVERYHPYKLYLIHDILKDNVTGVCRLKAVGLLSMAICVKPANNENLQNRIRLESNNGSVFEIEMP